MLEVFNASVFYLNFDEIIKGDVYFRGTNLHCEKYFTEPLKSVKSNTSEQFIFQIQLKEVKADFIKNGVRDYHSKRNISLPEIGLGQLMFFIEGDATGKVTRRRLTMPRSVAVNLEKIEF